MNFRTTLLILLLTVIIWPSNLFAQENYKKIAEEDSAKYYFGISAYPVKKYEVSNQKKLPKNIILMIGDGMGATQIAAALTANCGELNLKNLINIGFSTTFSADNFITDSGAGGTALATGVKTYNGAIGVGIDRNPIKNIREILADDGKATGVVSTSAITHATPASFVAHQAYREKYEAIATDFLNSNIDVFIGGGMKHFTQRADGLDLTPALKAKGFKLTDNMVDAAKVTTGKLAALVANEHLASVEMGRGNMLEVATETAIRILNNDPDGFFLMVEGSQIDWGGHQNDMHIVVSETLDFDKAIGKALEFAAQNKETLIIVTADHETGGLAITGGNMQMGNVTGKFASGDHTAVMVPVYAFGPGAELFRGFYDNTDIVKKIKQLIPKQ